LQKLFPAEFKSRQTKFGCLSLLWLGLHHFSESRTGRAWDSHRFHRLAPGQRTVCAAKPVTVPNSVWNPGHPLDWHCL